MKLKCIINLNRADERKGWSPQPGRGEGSCLLNWARSGLVEQGPGPADRHRCAPEARYLPLRRDPPPQVPGAWLVFPPLPRPRDLAPQGREGAGDCSVGAAESCQTFTPPCCRDVSQIPDLREGSWSLGRTHRHVAHSGHDWLCGQQQWWCHLQCLRGLTVPLAVACVSFSASKGGEEPVITDLLSALGTWVLGTSACILPRWPLQVMLVTVRALSREALPLPAVP